MDLVILIRIVSVIYIVTRKQRRKVLELKTPRKKLRGKRGGSLVGLLMRGSPPPAHMAHLGTFVVEVNSIPSRLKIIH